MVERLLREDLIGRVVLPRHDVDLDAAAQFDQELFEAVHGDDGGRVLVLGQVFRLVHRLLVPRHLAETISGKNVALDEGVEGLSKRR